MILPFDSETDLFLLTELFLQGLTVYPTPRTKTSGRLATLFFGRRFET